LIGGPANPLDAALVRAIAEAVNSVPGIVEAHLPQCYIAATMSKPAQVLVVVVDTDSGAELMVTRLTEGLAGLTLPDHHLDILPVLLNSELLPTVRKAACRVDAHPAVSKQPKKWWKF